MSTSYHHQPYGLNFEVIFENCQLRAREMAQWMDKGACHQSPILVLGTYMANERNDSHKLSSKIHMCAVVHAYHAKIKVNNTNNLKMFILMAVGLGRLKGTNTLARVSQARSSIYSNKRWPFRVLD